MITLECFEKMFRKNSIKKFKIKIVENFNSIEIELRNKKLPCWLNLTFGKEFYCLLNDHRLNLTWTQSKKFICLFSSFLFLISFQKKINKRKLFSIFNEIPKELKFEKDEILRKKEESRVFCTEWISKRSTLIWK